MWFADENGFYFATFSPKDIYKQLQNNPKVEVCFYNNAAELIDAKYMRVKGKIEFSDDGALIKKVTEERAFLEQIIGRPIGPITKVFRIYTGEIHFWTMADALKEPELERIKF